MVPDPELIVTTPAAVRFTVAGEQTGAGLVTVICGLGKTVTEVDKTELHPVSEVIVH
ncbi:hypothetical protein D3C86_1419430 [compost metagenome]